MRNNYFFSGNLIPWSLQIGFAVLLFPIIAVPQERVEGYDWETIHDVVFPDGTRRGLTSLRFTTEAACLTTRNNIVLES